MTPSIPRLAREAIELGAKATKGPWNPCGASDERCRCGHVWSKTADLCVTSCSDIECPEEQHSYGGYEHEQLTANQHFIAHAGTHYGTLARYVEDTAAIVEAAGVYIELEEKANELAAQGGEVDEFQDAVRALSAAYRALMEKVRAYRAKGAT